MANESAPRAVTPAITVAALAPIIEAHADESERSRSLSSVIVEALRAAGLSRLCVPVAFGGLEADPLLVLDIIERVAQPHQPD